MEIPQLAKLLHTSEAVIRGWLKRQGVQLRRRKAARTEDRRGEAHRVPPTATIAQPPSSETAPSVRQAKPRRTKVGNRRGRPRVEITPTQWRQIKSDYLTGKSIGAIANTIGCSYSTVRRALIEGGVPLQRRSTGATRTIPESRLEEVRRLRQAGLTTQQIAEEFQVPLRTAYYWLSKTSDLDR